MSSKYDLIVVGAGPAGATLARLIGNKYRVLLVDKRQGSGAAEQSGRGKCCGGLLAPDAQKMLSVFGFGLPAIVLQEPQIFTVRTIDIQNRLERLYQRHYINIDRQKFDQWMLSLVPAAVRVEYGCHFRSFEKISEGLKVNFIRDNTEFSETTRILVGADGADSAVRKLAFPSHEKPKPYLALQEWFKVDTVFPYFSAIFDREVTDFYSWTIPKGEYLLVGSALSLARHSDPERNAAKGKNLNVRGSIQEKFNLLKNRLTGLGFDLSRTIRKEGAFIARPLSARQLCFGEGNIALIGEAAGWISPSSAEGLSYAFRSALALAQSLSGSSDNYLKRYIEYAGDLKYNIMLKNLKAIFMYNNFLRWTIMRSGLKAVKTGSGFDIG